MPDKGMLVLEDGSSFVGQSMAAAGEWVGEVVFNTSMTGYQEIITDPSYWGQMVVFTCPHIGNVGVNAGDDESDEPYLRAVLVRKMCTRPSNWRSEQALPEYLGDHGIPALSGVDTRRLTLILREKGVMRAALSTVDLDPERLLRFARSAPDMSTLTPVQQVTVGHKRPWRVPVSGRWRPDLILGREGRAASPHVVVIGCGTKRNIMRHLVDVGARVTEVPSTSSAEEILAERPDGLVISNGPGDPEMVPETVATVRRLLGRIPVLGICLGHQIIAQAVGGRIYKLPFGHHGSNHPVMELATGRVEITAQNHNYAVEPESLRGLPVVVTHTNLYDGTIEGLRHLELPVSCVQYHPEASPGPHDSLHRLRGFVHSLA